MASEEELMGMGGSGGGPPQSVMGWESDFLRSIGSSLAGLSSRAFFDLFMAVVCHRPAPMVATNCDPDHIGRGNSPNPGQQAASVKGLHLGWR